MFLCKEVPMCCYELEPKMKKVSHYLYRYQNMIGKGKFSNVYAGIDTTKEEAVAIKVINLTEIKESALMNLLNQEVELISNINHPNITKCYGVLKSQNNYYIVMELCQKDNLEILLRKKGKFEEKDIQRYIYDVFLGLEYLAQKSIVHRDLKISNILIGEKGKAKICDFGFATKCMTQSSDIFIGTPEYMTPEALINQLYGPKTDIWAFGIMIYELLHGYTPLSACSNKNDLMEQVVEPVVISQSISSDLKCLIEKCLEPNYHDRISIYELAKHPYILSLKKKYHINTQIFKPLLVPKTLKNAKSMSNMMQSDVVSERSKKFPSHFDSLNLPEFQSIRMDYSQAASLIHYCRLVDKGLASSYNQQLAVWLIYLINMLEGEESLRKKSMTKQEHENLKKVIHAYYEKYHWRYSYLQPNNKPKTTKQIIYLINKLLTDENNLTAQTILKHLQAETLKLKKSLVNHSLRGFQAESECESIMKKSDNNN